MFVDVLVCDDERHIVRLISVNLKRQGHSVTCAYSGRGAIELMKAGRFDIVVLDDSMPGMSGYEVREWMFQNEETRETKVIMLDRKAQDEDLLGLLRQDADDPYLSRISWRGTRTRDSFTVVSCTGSADLSRKVSSSRLDLESQGLRFTGAFERTVPWTEIQDVQLGHMQLRTGIAVRTAEETISVFVQWFNLGGYFVVVNSTTTRKLFSRIHAAWLER